MSLEEFIEKWKISYPTRVYCLQLAKQNKSWIQVGWRLHCLVSDTKDPLLRLDAKKTYQKLAYSKRGRLWPK